MEHEGYSLARINSPKPNLGVFEKFKTWREAHKRTIWKCLLWPILAVLGLFQLAIFVIIIAFIVRHTADVAPSSLEFALYKNSHLKECTASNSPPTIDCALLYDRLLPGMKLYDNVVRKGQNYLNQRTYSTDPSHPERGSNYTWCELAGCLSSFQVIPSTPRQAAFTYTGIVVWSSLNIMGFFAVLDLKSQFLAPDHRLKKCQGLGFLDWGSIIYKPVAFIFWCYSFATMIADIGGAEAISILGWVSLWCTVESMQYHPLSCALASHPRFKTQATRILIIAAVAQCIGSCYIFYVERHYFINWPGINPDRKYDCLEAQMPTSAGIASQCSPQQLCAKEWLFIDPWADDIFRNMTFLYGGTFFLLTLVPILRAAISAGDWLWNGLFCGHWKSFRSLKLKYAFILKVKIGMIFMSMVLVISCGIIVICQTVETWGNENWEAGVSYDMECRVLHVALSPSRQYLDVSKYNQGLRIARMWFNA